MTLMRHLLVDAQVKPPEAGACVCVGPAEGRHGLGACESPTLDSFSIFEGLNANKRITQTPN